MPKSHRRSLSPKHKARKTPPLEALLSALAATYPEAHCELNYQSPLDLLVATILSAQCTDARVNQVTPALFARCPTARHYAEIPQTELETLIQSTGFFRSKARHIQGCARALLEHHRGQVPNSLAALVQLPGVGRKTANVVLGEIFDKPEGIVVDTHVKRLAQRLGLSSSKTPEKIETDLLRIIPEPLWAQLSHWLIWHGRRRCSARKPDCARCELRTLCPSASPHPPSTSSTSSTA